MNGDKLLKLIFSPKWREKFPLSWCDHCDKAIIGCQNSHCEGTSCNGAGCYHCGPIHNEFNQEKISVKHYLTDDEFIAYRKGQRLKDFILLSLEQGHKAIDWKYLYETGELSENDEQLFSENLTDKAQWKRFSV